jgi:hypothetical protein
MRRACKKRGVVK